MSVRVDLIDFELFKNALFAAADEMAVTVCRTTYSGVLRDNMDFSTSIADPRGRRGRTGPHPADAPRVGSDRARRSARALRATRCAKATSMS